MQSRGNLTLFFPMFSFDPPENIRKIKVRKGTIGKKRVKGMFHSFILRITPLSIICTTFLYDPVLDRRPVNIIYLSKSLFHVKRNNFTEYCILQLMLLNLISNICFCFI